MRGRIVTLALKKRPGRERRREATISPWPPAVVDGGDAPSVETLTIDGGDAPSVETLTLDGGDAASAP